MRQWLALSVLLLAGCGQSDRESRTQEDLRTFDVTESQGEMVPPPPAQSAADYSGPARSAGPDVGPSAAPGVAFNYRYAFRLPRERVDLVQEQHARTCEQLGINRCRITGMRYRVDRDGDIEAMLAFKLEPGLARRFGRSALDSVVQAEGMLVEAEITGTDVGSTIRATDRSIEEMTEELGRLETRLSQRGLPSAERSRIESEAQILRQAIRNARTRKSEDSESLATTPMLFQYGSGELAPGFDSRPSFAKSLERALDNFLDGILILFVILVTLLPWMLVAGLAWWLVRLFRRRWSTNKAPAPGETGIS